MLFDMLVSGASGTKERRVRVLELLTNIIITIIHVLYKQHYSTTIFFNPRVACPLPQTAVQLSIPDRRAGLLASMEARCAFGGLVSSATQQQSHSSIATSYIAHFATLH